MVQACRDLDLPEEPVGTEDLGKFGRQDLDGYLAPVLHVFRGVHRGHAAPAQLALDAVAGAQSGRDTIQGGMHGGKIATGARSAGGWRPRGNLIHLRHPPPQVRALIAPSLPFQPGVLPPSELLPPTAYDDDDDEDVEEDDDLDGDKDKDKDEDEDDDYDFDDEDPPYRGDPEDE